MRKEHDKRPNNIIMTSFVIMLGHPFKTCNNTLGFLALSLRNAWSLTVSTAVTCVNHSHPTAATILNLTHDGEMK